MTTTRKRWTDEELDYIESRHLGGCDRRVLLAEVNDKFGNSRSLAALNTAITRLTLPHLHRVKKVLTLTSEASEVKELARKVEPVNYASRMRLGLLEDKSQWRSCLVCSTEFLSEHFGNRCCDPCRKSMNHPE